MGLFNDMGMKHDWFSARDLLISLSNLSMHDQVLQVYRSLEPTFALSNSCTRFSERLISIL